MNAKKMIRATILAFIVMFILGGLWHAILMVDFYKELLTPESREPHQIQFIASGVFLLALSMAYLYPKGYRGGSPIKEGLVFGVIMGLIWIIPHGLVMHGMTATSGKLLLVDGLWHLFEQGMGGIVIASVYGRDSESTST